MYCDSHSFLSGILTANGYTEFSAALDAADMPAGKKRHKSFRIVPGMGNVAIENPRRAQSHVEVHVYYTTSEMKSHGGLMLAKVADDVIGAARLVVAGIRGTAGAARTAIWGDVSVSTEATREGDFDYIVGTITVPVTFALS